MSVRSERDYYSFEELGPQEWARRVKAYGVSILAGIEWDAISASYPTSSSEVYQFKSGGLAGTIVATVTVIYTSSTKEDISTVERT